MKGRVMGLAGRARRRFEGRDIRRRLLVVPVVVLAVGASACSGSHADDGAAASTTAPSARRLPLVADVLRQPGGTMSSRTPTLVVAPGGRALLAFAVGDVRLRCARSAVLRVGARELGGLDAAGAGSADAYVSLETGVADLADGASLGGYVVAPGSPHVTSTADGEVLTWDIARLLRWSAGHQPGSAVFGGGVAELRRGGPSHRARCHGGWARRHPVGRQARRVRAMRGPAATAPPPGVRPSPPGR